MKYIRTKEANIYKRLFKDRAIVSGSHGGTCDKDLNPVGETIIKEADTIEELCDEFVYKKNLYNKIEKRKDLEHQTIIRLFGMSFFDLYIEEWKDIYGAIWTDKGLVYVAKMNDKGELELL